MPTSFLCERATEHAETCTSDPDRCGHWCCKVVYWQRGAGLRLSSEAVPHVRERDARAEPRGSDPAWEKGLAGEHRPDGSFMPLLDHECLPMRLGETRHLGGSRYIEERLRATKNPDAQQPANAGATQGS